MKSYLLLLLLPIVFIVGCAYSRPHLVETITNPTNGITTRRELWLPGYALWPASQTIERQRASIGKTLSAGLTEANQDSGGTNMVEALRSLDSILKTISGH